MTWANGTVYRGSFVNDLKEGYGILMWPDRRQYEGMWVNGRQDGEGYFTNSQGIQQKAGIT